MYRRKYLGGFIPFWPTYPIGFYLRVFAADMLGVLAGKSGRMYFRQFWQQKLALCRVAVIAQVPRALLSVIRDETRNIWRARLNNRVV